MRMSDWSSDVVSADLPHALDRHLRHRAPGHLAEQGERDAGEDVALRGAAGSQDGRTGALHVRRLGVVTGQLEGEIGLHAGADVDVAVVEQRPAAMAALDGAQVVGDLRLDRAKARRVDLSQEVLRSEEHTSELQSLMRISYAVFGLKKKKKT